MRPNDFRVFQFPSTTAVLALAVMAAWGLTACGNAHLSCNDDDAKKEVLNVIHSHIDTVAGFDKRIKPHLGKRYLSDVSTTEADSELGRYACSATYNYEFKNKTRKVEIVYSLKYLEDQKKSQASASVQPVKIDYLVADAGG